MSGEYRSGTYSGGRNISHGQNGASAGKKLPLALKWMVKNEEDGHGEVTSFGALCTALSATIGTGNIVGVATAIGAGDRDALFWMEIAAFLRNGDPSIRRDFLL